MLLNNVGSITARIAGAAKRVGRSPDEVTLVAVTKTVGVERIREAVDAGLRIFGENRVQEAAGKIDALGDVPDIGWHMIGTVQRNKAGKAVELFDVIESVDSLDLAARINRYAGEANKKQRIFVQVKLSDEESKHGMGRGDLQGVIEALGSMENLVVEGLMTIPPFFEDAERARPFFRDLRGLRDALSAKGYPVGGLSMGMSNDFEVAVEEGATVVRIGTAIFGGRT